MKNLKKVLALVVALTMVLGTVSFAFTDVEPESDVYTAVQTLSSLNILNGYEDGTFGPEKDITRAEFAAVVCRALDMKTSGNAATPFADVPADHWASGYISLVAGQGIVNGYGDGNFGPEDNVTYAQAIKMLVVALGFEPMASQKGGYPTGYLVVANQYGLTDGIASPGDEAPANRGIVAQLTFNALDIPMMSQTGFGTNVVYEVQDGKGDRDYQTLLTGLDVAKRDGVVVGTPVINANGIGADEVRYEISVDGLYGVTVNNPSPAAIAAGERTLTVAEGVNVDEYFGIASTIYVKEVKTGKWEVIAIMPGEASETVELTKADIAEIVTDAGKITEIKYYESETATKETTLKLDSLQGGANNDIIYNNAAAAVADVSTWGDDTVITVINNNDNSAYDMIIAKEYAYDIIEEVEADRDRITLKNVANTMTFDFEDEDVINTIVDKDGNAVALADFAEGDVIAYITESGFKGFAWCEVINLGQNVVTGTVTEKDDIDNTVSVDGVEYELVATNAPSIAVSDEGTFFLTATGKIFAKDTTASISSNYAYVLEAGYGSNTAFGNAWQLRLLTKDGNIAIYDMKDTFEVEVSSGATYVTTKYAATANGSTQAYNASNPVELASIASDGQNHKANYANRLVTYKLDSNNAIKEIKFLGGSNVVNITAPAEFKAAAQTINKKVIADNAVIFNIDASDMDATKVTEVGSLVDETMYTGLLARVDANESEYNCFVIESGASAIDYTQPIAIVDGTSKGVDANDDDVIKVTYYTENDETAKVLEVNDDTVFVGNNNENDLVKGAVIMFAADASGVATDVAVIAKPAAAASSGEVYAFADAADDAIQAEDEIEFVIGYMNNWRTGNGRVVEYVGSSMYWNGTAVATNASANDEIVVTSAVNGYTVVNNTNSSRAYIAVADWQADADIDKYDAPYGTYFFAKLVDGVVEDIVVLGDRANN